MANKKMSLDQLATKVKASRQGFTTMTAGELRQFIGKRKLGRFVIAEMIEKFGKAGLGFFPIPPDNGARAEQLIRVYRLGSPVDLVITAATRVDDDGNEALHTLVLDHGQPIAAELKVRQVKKIIAA